MPVIRQSGRGEPMATIRGNLTDLLVNELEGQRTRRGPIVFEIPVDEPGKMDVIVIWDAWRKIPVQDRSSIIRNAYQIYARDFESGIYYIDPTKKPDDPLIPSVVMATGATPEEADATNLLPVEVRPDIRKGEVDEEDLQSLMIEAGAIETPSGLQLRFPNAQMAADAHAFLKENMPDARWVIV